MLFIIIFFSLSIFYKGKGYQENIYEKVNIDNLFYIIEVRDVLNKLNYQYSRFSPFTEAKKNVLIVGNSHADDLFLILKNNSYYSEEFNFHVVRFDFIEKNLNNINTNKQKTSELFTKSDIIIFSNRWSKSDIEILENFIPALIKTNKLIIFTNQNVNLPSTGKRDVTFLDKFIIDNKRLPNNEPIFRLEREYIDFMINDRKRNRFNNYLKELSEKYNIPLLDKSLYQCNYQIRICEIFTPLKEKINYNDNHHTLAGIGYLGKNL